MVNVDKYIFHLGSGMIALLPDRLPLPTEDIAWIELRDDEGNLYVEVETTDTGYTLSSNGQFVPIVLASVVTDGERSEEHTSELQSRGHLVCRLLLEKRNN